MYLCVWGIDQAWILSGHVFVCLGYRPSKDTEGSCICVLGVSILPLSTILIFYFGIVPTVWYVIFWNRSDSVVCYVFNFIS